MSLTEGDTYNPAINRKETSGTMTKAGNIDLVLSTLDRLIDKLATIKNMPALLEATDFDSLNSEHYFSDFNLDKGNGYMHNNFGQDLRNFKRFVENAKLNNNHTVWLRYS